MGQSSPPSWLAGRQGGPAKQPAIQASAPIQLFSIAPIRPGPRSPAPRARRAVSMATLRLYNTLTRSKNPFAPINPTNVRMYACGPTVYDFAHIGNSRPVIVFDVLFRLLRHFYGPDHVTYVRNVTDVDDKINARAAERGVSIRDLTDGTLKQFHEDIRALGVLMSEDVNEPGRPPRFVEPRAINHIEEMKALIERLVANGHAYV